MADERRTDVLIAGGGIAGVEALLALADLAGDRVSITLVSPDPELTYKPLVVDEPFTDVPAERHELAPLVAESGGEFVGAALSRVRVEDRVAELDDGSERSFDAAVICVGARQRPVYSRAETLRTTGEPLPIDSLLRDVADHPSKRLAFLLPPGGAWPLPIYELALLSERRAREQGLELRLTVVTPESAPLIAFGPAASAAVEELLRTRGIEVIAGRWPREGEGGRIDLVPGDEELEAGAMVALPALEGPGIPGLPADERGFLPIDDHARVRGADGVYAAGDGTNFPIKHGGLGTQQADAAAEQIAASAGAGIEPRPFHPVLRGRLITGDETLSLAADVTGGAGEGEASPDPLWWPPQKVAGRYLSALLAGEAPHDPGERPVHGVDVEVALPREWHREPMALDPLAPPKLD